MVRFWTLILIASVFCGCGREGIDAADRAVMAAREDLGQRMTEQRLIVASLGELVCGRIAEEKENCRQLREVVQTAEKLDLVKMDLTDAAALDQLRRTLRLMEQQSNRLEQYPNKYRQLDGAMAKEFEQLALIRRKIEESMERYDTAVRGYNRALRTFPESVTNNMFLRLKSRGYLNTDQRTRNNPVRR